MSSLGLLQWNKSADWLLLFPGLVWMLHQLSDQHGPVWVYSSLAVLQLFKYEDDEDSHHTLSHCKPMAQCNLKQHYALWMDIDLWALTQASIPLCQSLTKYFYGMSEYLFMHAPHPIYQNNQLFYSKQKKKMLVSLVITQIESERANINAKILYVVYEKLNMVQDKRQSQTPFHSD